MKDFNEFLLLFNAGMAVFCILAGYAFLRSKGRASRFIAGYNTKSEAEKQEFDEEKLCNVYGRRMTLWSANFIAGIVIDSFFSGAGTVLAWCALVGMLIFHITDINKHEKDYKKTEGSV